MDSKKFFVSPEQGEVSEFYCACRSGAIDRFKQLLQTISNEDLNRLEPNGNTPLHAACYYGHTEIVRLLLHERDCERHYLNRHGLTAYEEAQTDEIRCLFHRPGNKNRFCDDDDENESMANSFIVSTKQDDGEMDLNEEFNGDQWLARYETSKEIEQAKQYLAELKRLGHEQSMWSISKLLKTGNMSEASAHAKEINEVLLKHVTQPHQFHKCTRLVIKYTKDHQIEHLLRLYTLETPFYRALAPDVTPLGIPIFMLLDKLKPRYFQGISYRGAKMTQNDLRAYRWALKNKGVIQTKTFCSTSLKRSVAERFAGTSTNVTGEKQSVLMIFHFGKICDTAINLGKITDGNLPCISEYENEAEVLILIRTFFTVRKIETTPIYTVYLENIQVEPNENLAYLFLKFCMVKGQQLLK